MESYQSLPKLPGVYFFKNAKEEIIYVGKAKSLRDRVSSYFLSSARLLPKTQNLVSNIASIDHIIAESEIDALILEANLIKKYHPYYNLIGKDGKHFPLIEIGIKDPVPVVKIVRQETDLKKLYFGPYPTGSDITNLLRFLRRIFPYVSQRHSQGKTCLRSHLGLCPCQNMELYRPNLKKMVAFLSGKRPLVQKQLTREMTVLAQNQEFEKAQEIKYKLEQINYITMPRTPGWEYESNPNLSSDRRNEELRDLQRLLGLPVLHHIEGYDISNTQGTQATGAQVTFVNGVPEKSLYRRYRIKIGDHPNDVAMMKEILSRRLKSDEPLPELIVVDGGQGQISAVTSQLHKVSPCEGKVKIIGLAKQLETIYLESGEKLQLPQNSPALHLLQRLRDEAHRFSRKYHFYLRSKEMLEKR